VPSRSPQEWVEVLPLRAAQFPHHAQHASSIILHQHCQVGCWHGQLSYSEGRVQQQQTHWPAVTLQCFGRLSQTVTYASIQGLWPYKLFMHLSDTLADTNGGESALPGAV
jgi:hypothetical protein